MRPVSPLVSCLLVAACSTHATGISDGGTADLPPSFDPIDITGKFASEVTLDVKLGAAGQAAPMRMLVMWRAAQFPGEGQSRTVASVWELCQVPLPGVGELPHKALGPTLSTAPNATLEAGAGGARFTLPALSFVIGARLERPAEDPLPTDASRRCSSGVTSGCVTSDFETGAPGVTVPASGLDPDADQLYLVLRVGFALSATARPDGTLDGTVSSAALEWHVLGCHLRSGAECSAAETARLETARPSITIAGGALRSHTQGFYFTCPIFRSDPAGSLAGLELNDAGTGADMEASSGARYSYTRDIQRDLDARGCASAGCHGGFTSPALMPLVYQPVTPDELSRNYQAVMPRVTGGRLVDQTPLPADMRARWLDWIAGGAPF